MLEYNLFNKFLIGVFDLISQNFLGCLDVILCDIIFQKKGFSGKGKFLSKKVCFYILDQKLR